ncbi:MAG TPA: gephyrin-like molybdotransferase Glp [Roseiflexaceae bacterium]|nr:gephyrin-like molybdotransferase Glp [Roseiflexaceae bacterium]
MQPMRRESPYPMVPIEEAQRIIAAHVAPLGVEEVSSLAADGRVLAEDVFAGEDQPDVPKAAVDGYALRAADGAAERRVLAEITAGATHTATLPPGAAVRIMTGAPLPPGADAVIMVEQTDERDGMLHVERAVNQGDSVHTVGQDIARGTLVLARGTALGAAEIGLLATVGRVRVPVYRRPIVAVLATGDEVHEPDAPLEAGGIRDSNRYALMAAAREAGCETISLGIARDDQTLQRAAILAGLERADLLLTSGGVSMGTRDLIKPLLAELGTVHFGRIAFKPGKPTTFATVRDKLVFGLPGYPVSSLVSFEVFVRPALRRLQGDARPERPRIRVTLLEPIKAPSDRPECQRAIVSWRDGQLTARSTGAQGSSRLLSLRGANALLLVPGDGQTYPAGAEIEALLTGPLVG